MIAEGHGTVALVGAGEFLPPISSVDRDLIGRLTEAPRVAIVPTASAPDGLPTFERWLQLGVDHFAELGAAVEPVRLITRADADDEAIAAQIASANFIYLSGGKPRYLRETLAGSVCWGAIRDVFARGGVVAGCSAGAMVLVGEMFEFPERIRTVPALGLVPGIIVIPHYGEFPIDPSLLISRVMRNSTVVGVEGTTALVGSGAEWTVLGRGGVTVMGHGDHTRYVAGQQVPLPTTAGNKGALG